MPLEKLNRARIVQALNRLGQLAEHEGVTVMGIRSVGEVEAHLDRFYPHDVLSPQARQVIADLLPRPEGETP